MDKTFLPSINRSKLLKHPPFFVKNIWRLDSFGTTPPKKIISKPREWVILHYNDILCTPDLDVHVSGLSGKGFVIKSPSVLYHLTTISFYVNRSHPNLYFHAGYFYNGELYGKPCMGYKFTVSENNPVGDIHAYLSSCTRTGYTALSSFIETLPTCPACKKEVSAYNMSPNGVCRFCRDTPAFTKSGRRILMKDIPKSEVNKIKITNAFYYITDRRTSDYEF